MKKTIEYASGNSMVARSRLWSRTMRASWRPAEMSVSRSSSLLTRAWWTDRFLSWRKSNASRKAAPMVARSATVAASMKTQRSTMSSESNRSRISRLRPVKFPHHMRRRHQNERTSRRSLWKGTRLVFLPGRRGVECPVSCKYYTPGNAEKSCVHGPSLSRRRNVSCVSARYACT